MSYHVHKDHIEYRADTVMRRTDYWAGCVIGMGVLMAVVVWTLI
jgi:hypothetical protein